MATKHFKMPKQTLQVENEMTQEDLSPVLDFISGSDQKEVPLVKDQGTLKFEKANLSEGNTQITLRISKALLEKVDNRARDLNMSRASFIKAVISIALKDGIKI